MVLNMVGLSNSLTIPLVALRALEVVRFLPLQLVTLEGGILGDKIVAQIFFFFFLIFYLYMTLLRFLFVFSLLV